MEGFLQHKFHAQGLLYSCIENFCTHWAFVGFWVLQSIQEGMAEVLVGLHQLEGRPLEVRVP
jgi:hypothetical protein